MRRSISALVFLIAMSLILTMPSIAQEPVGCQSDYTVQTDEWLSKIADAELGDYRLYPAIIFATNARSASDDGYAIITDPWVIIPDSKLCIPGIEIAQAGLTLDVLDSAEYHSEWTASKKAPLTDGEYREQAAPGSATYTDIRLMDRMAFGVSSAGQDMAAVIMVTNPGGSGTFFDLAVVVQQDGSPVNIASAFLGDRVQISSLYVKDGDIVVDMVTQGPDDAFCCPTQRVTKRYALKDTELVETTSEVIDSTVLPEGTLWTLVSYIDDEGSLSTVPAGTTITAEFQAGKLVGDAGCNAYSGAYEVEGDRLTLGPLGATMMSCGSTADLHERAYLAALETASSYEILDGQLQLADAGGKRILSFVEAVSMPLIGTVWELRSYNDGHEDLVSVLAGTETTAIFDADGSVAGSAGCNSYTASYEADDDSVTIGPAATTRMMCAEPEGIMEQEAAFLAALGSATTYRIRGDALELTDDDGTWIARLAQPVLSRITGAVWKWERTQTPVDETVVLDPSRYTLEFSLAGQVSIQADCNRGTGTYTTDGKHLSIEIMTTTLAACPPGSLGDQFVENLNAAAIHFMRDDDLYIDLMYDSGTMRFARDE
jgi:heat shock protein HslJ